MDAVVVLTPLSDSTRGLIEAAELAAMSDGTLLVNAARGPIVEQLARWCAGEELHNIVRTGAAR